MMGKKHQSKETEETVELKVPIYHLQHFCSLYGFLKIDEGMQKGSVCMGIDPQGQNKRIQTHILCSSLVLYQPLYNPAQVWHVQQSTVQLLSKCSLQ